MKSDVQHRSESVVDPLTGMLNRTALSSRVNELTEQSKITGHPVCVIVCDVDHFKAINDDHGPRAETPCSRTSRTSCESGSVRSTWPTGSEARSSSCSSLGPTRREAPSSRMPCASRYPRTRWPAACT